MKRRRRRRRRRRSRVPSARYKLIPIGEGFTGTAATIRQLVQRARAAAQTQTVQDAAHSIVGPHARAYASAKAVRRFLADKIMFQADPIGVELLRWPPTMLEEISTEGVAFGDCDDVATLGAALGIALGLAARFVVLAFTPTGPFEHVYSELFAGGDWVELDTTRPVQYPADYQAARRATFDA